MRRDGGDPRDWQTTSNVGHLKKPSIQALIHGLNRHYYSMVIDYRKNELEEQMLTNLYKKTWAEGLRTKRFEDHAKANDKVVKNMLQLTKDYNERVKEEEGKTHVDGGDPDGSYSVTHHFDKDEEVGLVSFTEVLIYLLVPLGAFLGVLGVVMTLKSA